MIAPGLTALILKLLVTRRFFADGGQIAGYFSFYSSDASALAALLVVLSSVLIAQRLLMVQPGFRS